MGWGASMENIHRVIAALFENEISSGFAYAILGVLGLALLGRLPVLVRVLGPLDRAGPPLLTTIGVLGTFVGIFIGLLDFNVDEIDKSVPKLLDGLKIAFATSILGMTSAVSLKIVQAVTPQPTEQEAEASPEAIYATLQSIDRGIERSADEQKAALEEVRKAISADADSSVLTQIQKLRTTVQDGQKELIQEFRDFARTMAENNSKAMIEALEKVIRDFNTQLNEQFGENFKQLNAAVGALLTWQENYRQHVETLESKIDAAVKGLESSDAALREIVAHTSQIPEALRSLQEILDGFAKSATELEAHLEAVGSLRDKAVEAFPIIEGNVKKLTDEFSVAVRDSLAKTEAALEKQDEATKTLLRGFSDLVKMADDAQHAFDKAIEKTLTTMQTSTQTAMEGHARIIQASADEMSKQTREAWGKTEEAINRQLNDLDQQMQKELTRVIEVMGRNLASLSEKFVNDYAPLTDRLRSIVRIAEGVSP